MPTNRFDRTRRPAKTSAFTPDMPPAAHAPAKRMDKTASS